MGDNPGDKKAKRGLIILGAGGFAKQVANAAIRSGAFEVIGFMDETIDREGAYLGIRVLRSIDDFHLGGDEVELICGVGSIELRMEWASRYASRFRFTTVVDPTCTVFPDSVIENNVVVLGGTVISAESRIGFGANVGWQCLVSHGVEIGAFTNLSPGVKLTGNVKIGRECEIGTNASVLPKIRIGDLSVVGAGAVVTRDIGMGCTAVGIPAKVIKSSRGGPS